MERRASDRWQLDSKIEKAPSLSAGQVNMVNKALITNKIARTVHQMVIKDFNWLLVVMLPKLIARVADFAA